MPIEIRIEDADLAGFSDSAKDAVKKAGEEYINLVLAEANRLESTHNIAGGPVEITNGMVTNATFIQRHAVGGRKVTRGDKGLRVASAVLGLIAGFMFDKDSLQEPLYLIAFLLVLAGAIVATTISTMRE